MSNGLLQPMRFPQSLIIRVDLAEDANAARIVDFINVLLHRGYIRDEINGDFGGKAVTDVWCDLDTHDHCTCSCHEPCDDDCPEGGKHE